MRSPYLVIFLGALVMGYAQFFHTDFYIGSHLITDVHVAVVGLVVAVLGAREHLRDSYLGQGG